MHAFLVIIQCVKCKRLFTGILNFVTNKFRLLIRPCVNSVNMSLHFKVHGLEMNILLYNSYCECHIDISLQKQIFKLEQEQSMTDIAGL